MGTSKDILICEIADLKEKLGESRKENRKQKKDLKALEEENKRLKAKNAEQKGVITVAREAMFGGERYASGNK